MTRARTLCYKGGAGAAALLTTTKEDTVIIHTTNDTWAAVGAVRSILRELIYKDLGRELSDAEFETICEFETKLAEMLEKEGIN